MRILLRKIFRGISREKVNFSSTANVLYQRYIKRLSYLLSLISNFVVFFGFLLYHTLTQRESENAFWGEWHRIAVLVVSGVGGLVLLFEKRLRRYSSVVIFITLIILFAGFSLDIALSERPKRHMAFSLVVLFGSAYVFTNVKLMSMTYLFSAIVFTGLNIAYARPPEVLTVYNLAFFTAWWMSMIRIRSLQRISEDQARQYERRLYDQRIKLARNLHDSLGGDLMQISLQLAGNTPRDEIYSLMQSVIIKTKNLVYALEPMTEERYFPDYVAMYVARMQNIDCLNVLYTSDLSWPKLTLDKNLNLEFLFTEWMSNVLKYAMANQINIRLIVKNALAYIIIQDNGIGYRWNGTPMGYGLRNISIRAELLNARAFARKSGKGTIFFLKGRLV